MELSKMDDAAILNALFDIAAVEANGDELMLEDEQDYWKLEVELSKRGGKI
jgi:hypothetical protein